MIITAIYTTLLDKLHGGIMGLISDTIMNRSQILLRRLTARWLLPALRLSHRAYCDRLMHPRNFREFGPIEILPVMLSELSSIIQTDMGLDPHPFIIARSRCGQTIAHVSIHIRCHSRGQPPIVESVEVSNLDGVGQKFILTKIPLHRIWWNRGICTSWESYEIHVQEWDSANKMTSRIHKTPYMTPTGDLDFEDWMYAFGRRWHIGAYRGIFRDWHDAITAGVLSTRDHFVWSRGHQLGWRGRFRAMLMKLLLTRPLFHALVWWSIITNRIESDGETSFRLRDRNGWKELFRRLSMRAKDSGVIVFGANP